MPDAVTNPTDCDCQGTGEIVVESCALYPYEGLPQYRAITRVIEKCPEHQTTAQTLIAAVEPAR